MISIATISLQVALQWLESPSSLPCRSRSSAAGKSSSPTDGEQPRRFGKPTEALDDLREIKNYIARDNPAAAQRVVKAIKDEIEILEKHPGTGRSGRLPSTRELVIARYPYIVAYRQVDANVQILAVVHTSRLWPDHFP